LTKKSKDLEQQLKEAHYRGWHIARTSHEGVTTEFEYSVFRFQQAFERWVMQLASITGMSELSYIEVVILHVIRMHDRPKTAAIIARQLNRDDIPNIQYCLRKLVKTNFCRKVKESSGKTFAFEVTQKGRILADSYAELRRGILTDQTNSIDKIDEKLRETTRLISLLTGLYDEAGRISATYSPIDITVE